MTTEAMRAEFEAASDAYDLIDRYLRNSMGDDDYAEYSEALNKVWQAALRSPAVTGLVDAARFYGDAKNWTSMSVMERGPLVDDDAGERAHSALAQFATLAGESHE